MEINGKKVVDATRAAKITITKRDTVDGDNKSPGACAAARAARRDIPECINARVHIGRVYVETQSKWIRYFTPEALRTEIVAFDRGGTFQPGEYQLRPPSNSEKESSRKAVRGSGSDTNRNRGDHAAKRPRKALIAKVKRHEVSGIRPKGANR